MLLGSSTPPQCLTSLSHLKCNRAHWVASYFERCPPPAALWDLYQFGVPSIMADLIKRLSINGSRPHYDYATYHGFDVR